MPAFDASSQLSALDASGSGALGFSALGFSGLGGVAIVAGAVVTIAWLVVSFQRAGAARDTAAWIGTVGFYGVLLSLFVHLVRRSLDNDSTAGLIGFGFLATVFGLGLLVAIYRAARSLRSGGPSEASATH